MGFGRFPVARAVLTASGEIGAYCSPRPSQVRVNGSRVPVVYDEATGMLTVSLERSAEQVELSVRWPRGATSRSS